MRRKLSVLMLLCSVFITQSFAQQADAILDRWANPSGEGQIQIYKKGNQYFGKLVWLKLPNDEATGKPKTDTKNPNAALRSRPTLGLEILKDFSFDGDDTYEDGTIYDPKSGKTYSCKMTLTDSKLRIRGVHWHQPYWPH